MGSVKDKTLLQVRLTPKLAKQIHALQRRHGFRSATVVVDYVLRCGIKKAEAQLAEGEKR
jgi:hypothetical protein